VSPPPVEEHSGGAPASGDAVVVTIQVEPTAATGGVVLATVRTVAARDVVLQGGVVSLGYLLAYRYLEGFFGAAYGKTAKRAEQGAEQPLPGPTLLREGGSLEQQVLLAVPPEGPATVDSALVLLHWIVGARVRYDGTEHADAEPVPVIVAGDGQGAALGAPEVVEGGRRPDTVTFQNLQTRRIRPGTRLVGDVVLGPARSGHVRSVRVELALVQRVPHGPWLVTEPARNPEAVPNVADTVVARQVLAESLTVSSSGPVQRWSFALEAPDPLPAPTLVREEFALRWVLRVVVERRRSRPTTVELEVLGGTRRG
jgi:hypothetical protein